MTKNFNMVIPFEYQDIQALSDDYFLVSEKLLVDRGHLSTETITSFRILRICILIHQRKTDLLFINLEKAMELCGCIMMESFISLRLLRQ